MLFIYLTFIVFCKFVFKKKIFYDTTSCIMLQFRIYSAVHLN